MDIKLPFRKKVNIDFNRFDFLKENHKLIKELRKLSNREPKERLITESDYYLLIANMENAIYKSLSDIKKRSEKQRYIVDSLFLQDSFNQLNQDRVESMHFATGCETDGKKVLTKIINLAHETQSVVYAKADTSAVRSALIYLTLQGFNLQGYFHIHPGTGRQSTTPSSTDWALDKLLLKGGYKAIGVIFSRDGFISFFSSNKFNVEIQGKGIEKINEKLYRFIEIN